MSEERSGRAPAGSRPAESGEDNNNTQANIEASDIPETRATVLTTMVSPGTASAINAALARGPGIEEPTLQGASFLVERITPVPPTRQAQAARAAAAQPSDDPTAAVAIPTSRPPPAQRETLIGAVNVSPAAQQSGMVQLIRGGTPEAPSYLDTAFVPVPGLAPPPAVAPVPAQGMSVQGLSVQGISPQGAAQGQFQQAQYAAPLQPRPGHHQLTVSPPPPSTGLSKYLAPVMARLPMLQRLADRIRGSQSARLGLIAVCGLAGVGLTLLIFSPRSPGPLPAQREMIGGQQPVAQRPPPQRPAAADADPVQVEERDRLLEKAVLAVEAGRSDEAIAIFRRYVEEDDNPAAAFMIQLLQMQLSQNGREQ